MVLQYTISGFLVVGTYVMWLQLRMLRTHVRSVSSGSTWSAYASAGRKSIGSGVGIEGLRAMRLEPVEVLRDE